MSRLFGLISVAGITMICYLVGMGVKASAVDDKWIPVIVGIVGGILGVVGLMTGMPEFPANDYINAAAIGIASGLAATGADQIGKQLSK